MKLDHENQIKVQQRLLTQRFDEQRKKMKDRFQTEMDSMEQRYKNKIKELEDEIKRMSGRSQLSNSEWLDKLKKQ